MFGVSMKPKAESDRRELLAEISMRTRSVGRRAAFRGLDGQDDVLLVQHLVVLEIVQQRGRCELGSLVRNTAVPLHDMRRPLLQTLDQDIERHLVTAGLAGQDGRAAAPRPYQYDHGDPEQQRHPRAFKELEEIGAEET